MKKTLLSMIVIAIMMVVTTAQAQTGKYAHINQQEIMKAMPGIDSIQTKLMAFQQKLEADYADMAAEYQQKKDKFDREVGTMSASVRKVRENEILMLEQSISEFPTNAQIEIEQFQIELLLPFQEKLKKAIDEVAAEQKINYIFDSSTLLYSDGGTDVSNLVKAKLGIK